ncbi:MAG: hypothetical protein ONB44_06095 [candidate division KSB1 bacterium]|nr:hypothetical protein [candidate division KSB1 bacterium]MDZ7301693.1 hypothetical protein [candidate division KSB1 bacterium]MDZ7312420.1 hypothetical protein [candidate division KSB1 bacterium]
MKKKRLIGMAFFFVLVNSGMAQIKVNPTGVNVNSSGPTVVFLTYGGLGNYRPAEAFWCGELINAAPDVGNKCDPNTIFGRLPIRYDLSSSKGTAFTDIMSIPPSVARRAYQAAQSGANSAFFYVRRFVSSNAREPDQYVAVTCRLAGGGARVPFALLDVKLAFETDAPVLPMKSGETPPSLYAEIVYNGSGQLKGRWEIVLPGDEPPAVRDLLTEATLPIEERGLQRRYTELQRFSVFLPPAGKFTLPGPEISRLPNTVEGLYMILLRIEASDDKEGDSNLAAAGAGTGVVYSGAVAGFPIPPLRYFVGSAGSKPLQAIIGKLNLMLPEEGAHLVPDKPIDFSWLQIREAAIYRVEIEDSIGNLILSALLQSGVGAYRAPAWLKDSVPDGKLRWRVIAIDITGDELVKSDWRTLHIVHEGGNPE